MRVEFLERRFLAFADHDHLAAQMFSRIGRYGRAGNTGEPSAPFAFTVDTTPPSTAPTIGGLTDDIAPAGPVANGGFTDDTRPELSGSRAVHHFIESLSCSSYLFLRNFGRKTVTQFSWNCSRAEPNSTVIVCDCGARLGVATADASGNWTFTPRSPLSMSCRARRLRACRTALAASPSRSSDRGPDPCSRPHR